MFAPSVFICPPGYISTGGPDNSIVCESPNSTNWLGAVAMTEGRDLDHDWRHYHDDSQ